MNIQYISDGLGQTTGVFIPIEDWNEFIEKLKAEDGYIPKEIGFVPEWHKTLVNERLENYNKNPNKAVDFNAFIDDLEKEL